MQVSSTIDDLIRTTSEPILTSKRSNAELDKEDFLLLLITQLRHQNPLEPVSNEAFASQLAQFSALEQLTNINESLESSQMNTLALTRSISNSLSTTLIGKRVVAESNRTYHIPGTQDMFKYSLNDMAKNVKIRILSQTGSVLHEADLGAQSAGMNSFTWDGIDKKGNEVAEGAYIVEVEAVGTDGEDVLDSIYTTGIITAVRFRDGIAILVVNNVEISLSEVREIIQDFGNNQSQ